MNATESELWEQADVVRAALREVGRGDLAQRVVLASWMPLDDDGMPVGEPVNPVIALRGPEGREHRGIEDRTEAALFDKARSLAERKWRHT